MLTELHEKVLLKICMLLHDSGKDVCWGLTGSTSFALQGMDYEPHDIDIQTDEATAYILGELLKEYEVQPVTFSGNEKIRSHFGKFLVDGMKVEVMGDIQKKPADEWENIIPLDTLLDYVDWNGYQVPVLKLSYEAEAYRKLGRLEKAEQLERFARERQIRICRNIHFSYKQAPRCEEVNNMDMKQAMKERHMVRKYTDEPIPEDIVEKLNHRVRENNEQYGLSIKLMTNDDSAVPGVIKLILAKGVNNFFIMAGPDGADELCGYCGADLMLYAQTLGLNTWWVGGTYNRKGAQEKSEGAKPVGIIAVGYGQTQGVPHKTKTAEQVSSYDGEAPQWFKNGIEAALLAPTALAKQAFTIKGKGNKVSISCDNGIFTGVDTGLVKYHFELGAGKDCFEWV